MEGDCQTAFGLSGAGRECFTESCNDLFIQCFVFCNIFAQNFAGFYNKVYRVCIECGCDKVRAGGTFVGSGRSVQTKLAVKMGAAGPHILSGSSGGDVGNPFFHTVELLCQDRRIAVG